MGSFLARVWNQQQLGYVPHTSVSGETWQFIKPGETTSAGAAGGTTLIDTGGDSGGADTYNGRYWVRLLTGNNEGHWKRIIDDDGLGTLTLENNGFDNQVGSGAEYEIWQSPEPVVVVDTSSGETDMVDAVRSEANDFWNDYYAVPITGTHRGKIVQITDFVGSSGTFTLAAGLGSALAAGDVVLLRKFVDVEGATPSLTHEYIPRPSQRVNFSKGDGVIGARGGTLAFNTKIRPSGTLSGDGVLAGESECQGLFQAVGLKEYADTTSTVSGGASTTTVIDIATATWERFTVGGMVIVNGEATFIDSIVDGGVGVDQLNVNPPLSLAPAASDVVYASRMYARSTDGDERGVCVEYEIDGVRTTMTGCKGNVTLQDGAAPMFAWNLNIDHWTREIEAAPYTAAAAYSTAQPVISTDRLAYYKNTKANVGGVTATPGTVVAPKNIQGSIGINGRAGFHVTNFDSNITLRELLDAASATLIQDQRWNTRDSAKVRVIYGTGTITFAVVMNAARIIQSPHPENQDGLSAVPIVWQGQDAGTATDGGGTIQKVPDFAFYLP